MSRRATKQLTLQFVLRTLRRLRMVTRLDQKHLAEVLKDHPDIEVDFLGTYLSDVCYYMRELGVPLNPPHPNGKMMRHYPKINGRPMAHLDIFRH